MTREDAQHSRSLHEEDSMDLKALEQAVRAAIEGGARRPALAALAGGADISPEFLVAAKTLSSRSGEKARESSPLSRVAELWD